MNQLPQPSSYLYHAHSDWFKEDPTWAALGYQTLESFLQTWVPQPYFHSHVPEDVRKAYLTTSYLLAHSWHHYPMYDQGLQHLLGILEMSVKMRAKQLGVSLTSSKDSSNSQPPKLASLIDQVCRHHQAKDLKGKLHWARKIRNYHAHPERYSFAPVIMQQAILPLLNLLNELFIESHLAKQSEKHLVELRKHLHGLQGKLLILEHRDLRYLMYQAQPLRAFYSANYWRSIWAFHPVLPHAQKALSQHRYLRPIVLCLSAEKVIEGGLQATEVGTGDIARIVVNENPINLPVWEAHQLAWQQASRTEQWVYSSSQQTDVLTEQNKLEHKFGWGHLPAVDTHFKLFKA